MSQPAQFNLATTTTIPRKTGSKCLEICISTIPAGSNAVSQTIFKPMFVLVGDSITEFGFDDGGWGTMMADTYRRKADVVNRGFGGYTSRMGVYVLDEFLNSFGAGRIKLVTLCFGANDASHPTGIG